MREDGGRIIMLSKRGGWEVERDRGMCSKGALGDRGPRSVVGGLGAALLRAVGTLGACCVLRSL